MTGTASFNGGTYFGITPYFTVGGGILLQKGAPSFTLTGHNTFTTRTMFPFAIDETDAVSVAYSVDPAVVQVLGGGVRVFLTSRMGAQIDYRISTAKIGGGLKIKVSTAPVELPSTRRPTGSLRSRFRDHRCSSATSGQAARRPRSPISKMILVVQVEQQAQDEGADGGVLLQILKAGYGARGATRARNALARAVWSGSKSAWAS